MATNKPTLSTRVKQLEENAVTRDGFVGELRKAVRGNPMLIPVDIIRGAVDSVIKPTSAFLERKAKEVQAEVEALQKKAESKAKAQAKKSEAAKTPKKGPDAEPTKTQERRVAPKKRKIPGRPVQAPKKGTTRTVGRPPKTPVQPKASADPNLAIA